MITLLMALFMVLFSISSVNVSKYKTLQQSLKAAFSGSILPGGKAIIKSGSQSTKQHTPATPRSRRSSRSPRTRRKARRARSRRRRSARPQSIARGRQGRAGRAPAAQAAARSATCKTHGLGDQVQTTISRRGLVVRVLTDKVLFDSGAGDAQAAGAAAARRDGEPAERRPQPPDRRRGTHRQRPDREQRSSRATGSCRPPARRPSCAT